MFEENIPNINLSYFYPLEIIRKWVTSLDYFYFYHDRREGQKFALPIRFSSKDDLLTKLRELGIEIKMVSDDDLKPIKGKSYTIEEYQKFNYPTCIFPDIVEPRRVTLFGLRAYVRVDFTYLEISVAGNGTDEDRKHWCVGNMDFEICLALEKELSKLDLIKDIHYELESDKQYVSKTFYAKQLGINA